MALKQLTLIGTAFACCAMAGFVGYAQNAAAPTGKAELIGAKKCIICHKKDGTGPSWEAGVHAKAMAVLSADQQKNDACLSCHSTGKLTTGEQLVGVQCESCHGAGSLYKAKATMESREKSIAAGLIVPDEKTCATCHNDKVSPECKAKPFDFKERVKKGVHAMVPDSLKKAKAPTSGGK